VVDVRRSESGRSINDMISQAGEVQGRVEAVSTLRKVGLRGRGPQARVYADE
jgi:hypothetical protein